MFTDSLLPRSRRFRGLAWTGERLSYGDPEIKGDTFAMTWARDDALYAAVGDPLWGPSHGGLHIERFDGGPEDYRIHLVNAMPDYDGGGGDGAKPSGMICVGGVLYLAAQNLRRMQIPAFGIKSQHGSDAHIIYSVPGGFWSPARQNLEPLMFPGAHFGGPAFINFGKDNANARDGHVYAVSGDQWDNGSNLRLGRVPADGIMRREAWEWVAAFTLKGEPAWSSKLEAAIPVLSMHRLLGLPEMVYVASLERYLLFTWRLREDFTPGASDLIVLEAPEPWGPFSWVHVEENWEGPLGPYCPRLPLKWADPDGKNFWLQFSGDWSPQGQKAGYYRSHVRPFRLLE